MKKLFLSISLISFFVHSSAQQPLSVAKKDFSYTFESSKGTNGSAVAWNPNKNIYYTVIAGNADYPIEAFSPSGNNLQSIFAGEDVRGLWYNPKTNCVEINTYSTGTLLSFSLDSDGLFLEETNVIADETAMPGDQSVGAYDSMKNLVWYFYEGYAYSFKASSGKAGKQVKLDVPVILENLNSTTMIATGKTGFEFGLLDYEDQIIYFFNRKGDITACSKLPVEAITNYSFWFSYANDRIFLYNADNRTWTSYRIF